MCHLFQRPLARTAFLLLCVIGGVSTASAASLPDSASFQQTFNVYPSDGSSTVYYIDSQHALGNQTYFYNEASATFNNNYTVPSLSIEGQFARLPSDGASLARISVVSQLMYFIEVSGPTSSVNTFVQSSGFVTVDHPENSPVLHATFELAPGEAGATINGSGSPAVYGGCYGYCSANEPNTNFQLNGTLSLLTDKLYLVILDVDMYGAFTDAKAFVDPYFSVPDGYSLSFSAGIGNTAPVSATPLPGALPLLAGGLGALGLIARRRRQRAA